MFSLLWAEECLSDPHNVVRLLIDSQVDNIYPLTCSSVPVSILAGQNHMLY